MQSDTARGYATGGAVQQQHTESGPSRGEPVITVAVVTTGRIGCKYAINLSLLTVRVSSLPNYVTET